MTKGSTGVETNIIIKLPKREKVSCNCKKCMNFRGNICYLSRKLYQPKCKWYATRDDYNK